MSGSMHGNGQICSNWGGNLWVCGLAALLMASSGALAQDPCEVVVDGSGTVALPPPGCAYLTADEVHEIVDGLPPDTTIELAPIHVKFICGPDQRKTGQRGLVDCGTNGGSFPGGRRENFTSDLELRLRGTGELSPLVRRLTIPLTCETHTAPRAPFTSPQDFDTLMWSCQGGIAGDADFQSLTIRAGDAFGLPSPGHTTLTLQGGTWQVDSFFDVAYEISYVGAPGGALDGLSGTTLAILHMEAAGIPADCKPLADLSACEPITCPDAAGATPVTLSSPTLPPEGTDAPRGGTRDCDQIVSLYVGQGVHASFPNGIDMSDPIHKCFLNVTRNLDPGTGDETEQFDSTMEAIVDDGSGPQLVTLTGPVTTVVRGKGGATTGSWATEILSMDLSGIVGGVSIQIRESPTQPSPGQTSVTDLGGGLYQIDSFFDVFVELSLAGGPFQPQTNGPGRMTLERAEPAVILPDPDLPPEGTPAGDPPSECDQILSMYAGIDVHAIFPGPIDFSNPRHKCFENVTVTLDPGTGDEFESFDSTVEGTFDDGSGPQLVTLTGPVVIVTRGKGGATTGSWDTEILSMSLSGDVGGIPIEIRESPGIPSTGRTSVADNGDGRFVVDSFFDVFTELSIDGGAWQPQQNGASRMTLTLANPPQPDNCTPIAVRWLPSQGIAEVTDCACLPDDACHVFIGANGPECTTTGCPPGETCTLFSADFDNDGTDESFACDCVPDTPCILSDPALCDGTCPPDEICTPDPLGPCFCDPLPCSQSDPATCGGDCPPDEVCTLGPPPATQCVCQPVSCDQSDPMTCSGTCPPDEVCTPDSLGGPCTCEPVPCDQSDPATCGGSCPPGGGVCLPDPLAGCSCQQCGDGICDPPAGEDECNCPIDCGPPPATETACTDGIDNDCDGLVDCLDPDCSNDPTCPCDQSDPATCGGACPPDEVCTPGLAGGPCSCVPVPCDQSDPATCGGSCAAGTVCLPDPLAGCSCQHCGDGVCDPLAGENQCNCPLDCGNPPLTETSCIDSIDNDCDGLIDCLDPDCANDPACIVCDVNADGSGCINPSCPDPPGIDVCQPRCANIDPLTGNITITECDCIADSDCHLELTPGPGTPCASPRLLPINPLCIQPAVGGTVVLPPAGCPYLSPDDVHEIIAGLPIGTTIELGPEHFEFSLQQSGPGGTLGGEFEIYTSNLQLNICGTGGLAGFNRFINIPMQCETHVGPRTPFTPVQTFPTDMFRMQGGIFGDSDFEHLILIAGTDFGLPSPGQTTLTQDGANYVVDSFFDIVYEIDYKGALGSVLDGLSGISQGTLRMQTGSMPKCVGDCPVGTVCEQTTSINADGTIDICCDCVPIPTGACCILGAPCTVTTQDDCENNLNGTYAGDGTLCDAVGSCCLPTGCIDIEGICCNLQGGLWNPTACANLPAESACTDGIDNDCDLLVDCDDPDCINDPACQPGICPEPGDVAGLCANLQTLDCDSPTGTCLPQAVRTFARTQIAITVEKTFAGDIDIPGVGIIPNAKRFCLIGDDPQVNPTQQTRIDNFFANTGPVEMTFQLVEGGDPPSADPNSCSTPTTCLFDGIENIALGNARLNIDANGHLVVSNIGSSGLDGVRQDPLPLGTTRMATGLACPNFLNSLQGTQARIQMFADVPGGLLSEALITNLDGETLEVRGNISAAGVTLYKIQVFDANDVLIGDFAGLNQAIVRFPKDDIIVMDCEIRTVWDYVVERCDCFNDTSQCGPVTVNPIPGTKLATLSCQGACPDPTLPCTIHISGMPTSLTAINTCDVPAGSTITCECPPVADCVPNADKSDCEPFQCPVVGGADIDVCQPRCVRYIPGTTFFEVVDCECLGQGDCHVVLPTVASPRGVPNPCEVIDTGGTVTLPPEGCEYLSTEEVHLILDDLPAGTTIELAPIHKQIACEQGAGTSGFPDCPPPGLCEEPGGGLGGNVDCFSSILELTVSGQGNLGGFNTTLNVPIQCQVHSGPRTPGDAVQDFDTEMVFLQGELFGDPDFCTFRVTGGTGFGMPSPGHTTLTQLPSGNWNVDSFFDVVYEIEFVGCAGSPNLSGLSGRTTATIRMQTGGDGQIPSCDGICPPGTRCEENRTFFLDGSVRLCCDCEPVICNVVAARSCCLHDNDDAGPNPPVRLCLDLAVPPVDGDAALPLSNVEPRASGAHDIEIDLTSVTGFAGGVTVSCTDNAGVTTDETGRISNVSVSGNTVRVQFVPALPDKSVCEVRLDCGATICVRGSRGDVDRNGAMNTGDASQLRFFFNRPAVQNPDPDTESPPQWDYDQIQGVTTGDFSQIRFFFNTTVPACPASGFPPAGTDLSPTVGILRVDVPGVGPVDVPVSGQTLLQWQDPQTDPATGQRSVQTEILSMDLSGFHPDIGNMNVRAGASSGLPASLGSVDPIGLGSDFPATASFDVFFEVEVLGVATLQNDEPLVMRADINEIPPRNLGLLSPAPGTLIDPLNPTSVHTLQIAFHWMCPPPFPPPGVPCPVPCTANPFPVCEFGDCPDPLVCTPDPSGVCSCEPVPCDQSDPATCGGGCPPDEVCTPDPVGCRCIPRLCEDSDPATCGGSCPPGTRCEVNTLTGVCRCVSILPPCSQTTFPICGGACPFGGNCIPRLSSGACECQ